MQDPRVPGRRRAPLARPSPYPTRRRAHRFPALPPQLRSEHRPRPPYPMTPRRLRRTRVWRLCPPFPELRHPLPPSPLPLRPRVALRSSARESQDSRQCRTESQSIPRESTTDDSQGGAHVPAGAWSIAVMRARASAAISRGENATRTPRRPAWRSRSRGWRNTPRPSRRALCRAHWILGTP